MKSNNFYQSLEANHSETRILRVFLISILIIVLYQGLQFINIKSIDRKHREVLLAKDQAIHSLQNLLFESFTIQRSLLNMAISENHEDFAQMSDRVLKAQVVCDQSLDALHQQMSKFDDNNNALYSKLKSSSLDYQSSYSEYIRLIDNNLREEAINFRISKLRPALDSYLSIQQEMVKNISEYCIDESNKIGNYASVSGIIFFIIGFVPFILGIVYFIYASIKFRLWVSLEKAK